MLEVLPRFPTRSIITKSALVLRDLDILAPMADGASPRRGLGDDAGPRAGASDGAARRDAGAPIETIRRSPRPASRGRLASPMIPALNDNEIEHLSKPRGRRAAAAGYISCACRSSSSTALPEWLRAHLPDRRARHVARPPSRGGKAYQSEWGTRMRGTGPYAEMLRMRFEAARRRFGLERGRASQLDTTRFRPPPQRGDQLVLF